MIADLFEGEAIRGGFERYTDNLYLEKLKKLYELVRNEIESNDPSHLTKFATCEILLPDA